MHSLEGEVFGKVSGLDMLGKDTVNGFAERDGPRKCEVSPSWTATVGVILRGASRPVLVAKKVVVVCRRA
jgi:hypothetical protein